MFSSEHNRSTELFLEATTSCVALSFSAASNEPLTPAMGSLSATMYLLPLRVLDSSNSSIGVGVLRAIELTVVLLRRPGNGEVGKLGSIEPIRHEKAAFPPLSEPSREATMLSE